MIIRTDFIGYRFASALAAVVISASAVCAQTAATTSTNAQAVVLEQKADAWLGAPDKWRSIAHAMERAAELRGASDAHAVSDLMLAAAARVSAKDVVGGRAVFLRAADEALAMGDVETAATAFTRAAVISAQLKDVEAAQTLRDKAERLTLSPLLSTDQRTAIRSQFAGSVSGANQR